MSVDLTDPGIHRQIEDAVVDAEGLSSIEIVVVLAPRSLDYRAEALGTAWVAAMLNLLLLVYIPAAVSEHLALLAVFATGWVAYRWALGTPFWLRLLVSKARREAGAARAAKVAFVEEAVTGTQDRTGILVFYSKLEQEFVVLADVGVERAAPEELAELCRCLRRTARAWPRRLEDALRLAGESMAGPLPVAPDDIDEIPNYVRVLEVDPVTGGLLRAGS